MPPSLPGSTWTTAPAASAPGGGPGRHELGAERGVEVEAELAGDRFTTLFDYGVFDRFPTLEVIVLESGGGWLGYWLDRIDAVYSDTFIGERVPLRHKPSDYVRERVWVSCDPDERSIPPLAERYGDRFLWASDFPHADHTLDYIPALAEMAAGFPSRRRRAFLGDQVRALFEVPDEARAAAPA